VVEDPDVYSPDQAASLALTRRFPRRTFRVLTYPPQQTKKQLHCHIHEYQITFQRLFHFLSLALAIRIHTMACTQHIRLKTTYFFE
jgi:hypothetical protein